MDIRFIAPELTNLDALKCEAILVPHFSDERPLWGVLGLIDWRLCGFLSAAIVRGFFSGTEGEHVLVPLRPRLTVDKLFLFGLGPERDLDDDALVLANARMVQVITRARVRSTALVLPGRGKRKVSPARAMEGFVAAVANGDVADEVTLIEPPEAQREMEPIVQRERRRARAVRI